MIKNLLTLILSFSFIFVNAQQVSTLVTGPDNFNDGLVQDSAGNIYASYYFGTVVTKITPSGQTSTHVSGLTDPNGLTFTPDGQLLIPEATANRITLVDSAGNKSLFASITNPSGLCYLPDGNLLVAQYNQDKVSMIDTAGNISDYWTGSQLNGGPVGIIYNAQEKTTYVGTFDDAKILKRDSLGNVTQLADLSGWCGFICEAGDYIYATAYSIHKIYRIAKDGSESIAIAGSGTRGQTNGALNSSRFNNPNGIIASKNGDSLFISDLGSRSLRIISDIDSIVIPTSIENEFATEQISIWPNPAKEFLNVYLPAMNATFEMEISDLNSRRIFKKTVKSLDLSNNTFKIALPKDLHSGIYHLKVNSNYKTETIPFLVK